MNTMMTITKYVCITVSIAILGIVAGCANSAAHQDAAGPAPVGQEPTSTSEQLADAEKAVAKEVAADRKICRTIKPTGTRFGERWCMTQAEWSKITDISRRETDKLQRGGMVGQPAGGGGR